jgi:signal transduction histidine kinase
VFQRSFSTKGTGRGLGTYSIKLLTERYLGGRVWFESAEGHGTTFHAEFDI